MINVKKMLPGESRRDRKEEKAEVDNLLLTSPVSQKSNKGAFAFGGRGKALKDECSPSQTESEDDLGSLPPPGALMGIQRRPSMIAPDNRLSQSALKSKVIEIQQTKASPSSSNSGNQKDPAAFNRQGSTMNHTLSFGEETSPRSKVGKSL